MTSRAGATERLTAGAVAGLLWAAPVSARIGGEPATVALTLVALAGSAALLLGPVMALAGAAPATRGTPGRSLLTGALLCVTPLALFAAVLHDKTHHRPLGGVTFGIAALVVLVAAVIIARRLPVVVGERFRGAAFALLDVLAVTSLAAALALASAPGARVHLLDAFLGVVAVAVVMRFRSKLPRLLRERGSWTWLAVATLGVAVLRLDPELSRVLADRAPVVLGLGAWAGG